MESSPDSLTPETRFFLEPASPAQRQYEALRAYFVEGGSSADVSQCFGYTRGSFRVLCHHFRRSKPDFFRELKHGPHTQPKKDAVRELILGMRKQNLSIYDIESALQTQETPLSTTAIWEILHEEGFARLPRRQDAERPATLHPTAAAVADCREFPLAPRRFATQLGGLFLFLPLLADCDLPGLVRQAGYPGSRMIPAPQAWLSLLGLKLSSTERKSHVMDLVFDEGLALFAGLNVVPKTTYANLNRLNQMGITFMTLRRRSPAILREVANTARSAWHTVHLDVPHRMYQTPKVIDQQVSMRDYEGPIRQMLITDLGHEEPTVLLTNDLRTPAAQRITRYAQRMLIENGLADAVKFFHLDALSSAVRLKIDFDVTLTEVASGLYRMLGRRIAGYESAHSRQLFRHFLNTPAEV